MTLEPINLVHALQIQAGLVGRKEGHNFEDEIANEINSLHYPITFDKICGHLFEGVPGYSLLNYIASNLNIKHIINATAFSTGRLATSEDGKNWLEINGILTKKCKSDVVVNITGERAYTFGVSSKQCNHKTPTNAQVFFTTASAFSDLLRENNINVSAKAEIALRQFCGDDGYRPCDSNSSSFTNPERYYWEETDSEGRHEYEKIFTDFQDQITKLLLQKAYLNDPFIPEFLIHKTRRTNDKSKTEVAIYTIEELIELSRRYSGFNKEKYSVKKGRFKDKHGIFHEAPRFGIIQMQRGGQKQHPTQLQFNLKSGYFYHLDKI